MISIKKRWVNIFHKIGNRLHDKQYIKHFFLMVIITIISGVILSIFLARSITVNDTVIRYTEPPLEEFESEGYSGDEMSEEQP